MVYARTTALAQGIMRFIDIPNIATRRNLFAIFHYKSANSEDIRTYTSKVFEDRKKTENSYC